MSKYTTPVRCGDKVRVQLVTDIKGKRQTIICDAVVTSRHVGIQHGKRHHQLTGLNLCDVKCFPPTEPTE